jgi:hypothetical protein
LVFIADVAYTNSLAGANSIALYAFELNLNNTALVNLPAGTLTTVGQAGVTPANPEIAFDISGATGTAYLTLNDVNTGNSLDEFYRLNLTTGALTLVGNSTDLLDFSVMPVPEPGTLALVAAAGAAGLALLRRRRAS